jgi:hypothetical protein
MLPVCHMILWSNLNGAYLSSEQAAMLPTMKA